MRSITRSLMPALFLALVSIVGSTVTALAQTFPPPVGTILLCRFRGDIVITRNGVDVPGTVTGSGTFRVTATGNGSASYIPVAIEATSTFPALTGTFKTRLDGTVAPQPVSTARSIGAGVFPVVIPMIYPAIVTDPDGVEYISEGNVNFLIPASNSFNPIVNEVSNLENSVTFKTRDGQKTFTLKSLKATFNN